MIKDTYSAIIIGSGISGLYAALKLSENDNCKDILLVTKSNMDESNSRYAQGGIAGVLPSNEKDSIQLHVRDTLEAGNGLVDVKVAGEISKLSAEVIEDLIKYGVHFDKDNNEGYALTLEGAHSVNRILHVGGDGTGRIIEAVLSIQALKAPKIKILENAQVTEILLNDKNEADGLELFYNNKLKQINAGAIILATGGLGQLFAHTTNSKVATADGMSLALKAGAVLQDLEFVQFHPTALYAQEETENRFLISESVRGEGAKLKNSNGEYFAEKYHQKAELAPRDILTRAIYQEMKETNSQCVYLDMTQMNHDRIKKRFPTITSVCEKHNIDVTKDMIPVSPAAHYSMGGVKIDINGLTSIKNLYAIGETACTSLHGANRLASNSLLECIVVSFNLAKHLANEEFTQGSAKEPLTIQPIEVANLVSIRKKLQNTMWKNAGIIRSKESLKQALKDIDELELQFDLKSKYIAPTAYELRNMVLVSKAIIIAALNRKESRGGHYRNDYPNSLNEAQHSYLTIGDIEKK